jgi:hypothetical protein
LIANRDAVTQRFIPQIDLFFVSCEQKRSYRTPL